MADNTLQEIKYVKSVKGGDMEILSTIFTFFQYVLDSIWLYYDFQERKDHQKQLLQYAVIVTAVSAALMALAFESLEKIIEVVNTPIGRLGLHIFETMPILGLVATSFLAMITAYKIWSVADRSDYTTAQKFSIAGRETLKLLLQLAFLGLTIALLAFSPTGIALTSAALAVCLVGSCVSIYGFYQDRQLRTHQARTKETFSPPIDNIELQIIFHNHQGLSQEQNKTHSVNTEKPKETQNQNASHRQGELL